MSAAPHVFLDTNVLVYWLQDQERAKSVDRLLEGGCFISVQVLNEFANVLRKKLGMNWDEIRQVHSALLKVCSLTDLTYRIQTLAMWLAERYGFTIYDANIVAAAANSGCAVVYSEDMQNGLRVEIPAEYGGGALRIENPFTQTLV
jgi:predicted nucleic acid-binding protein